MKNLTILALTLTLLGGCSAVPKSLSGHLPLMPDSGEDTGARVEVLSQGHDFSNLEPREYVFSSAYALARWAKGGSPAAADVAAAAEGVDFSKFSLIYVAAGMKPNAGYRVGLGGGLSVRGGFASLDLRLEQPAPGEYFSSKLASPYLLVKVPAADYRRISVNYEACDQKQLIMVSR
ncbi:MAG: protease complex subunit PrcB family protein [bacterium]